ncbi:hypothetical protein EVAR_32684_1 [Eumeta japonica]|uniref:Uncharacterized protein n=1 Tax=Eumeta variegata TaxID=151549 RepID=A0A4C1VPP9_EUMVA|nr:hypothetical protein EVAR_32684_1 [Eumeta japonica]
MKEDDSSQLRSFLDPIFPFHGAEEAQTSWRPFARARFVRADAMHRLFPDHAPFDVAQKQFKERPVGVLNDGRRVLLSAERRTPFQASPHPQRRPLKKRTTECSSASDNRNDASLKFSVEKKECPTWLHHKDGAVRTVKYHNLTDHRREVGVSAAAFRPMNESSSCPFPHLLPPSVRSLLITYLIPDEEAGNALVTPLELRMSMGGGKHLLCDGSPARLLF